MMNKYITTYGGNGYFNLANLAVNANTVFKGKFMPMVAPNDFIFGNFSSPYLALFHPDSNNTWPSSTFRWYINGNEGVAFTASTLGDILGTEFDFEMSNGSITINGQTTTARTFNYHTYSTFGIGYAFSPQFDDAQPIRWGSFQVYDGQTLVYDLVPAYNNGQYCFKNNVDGTFIYAVGNVDGEVSSINVTASKSSLAYTGETISIEVECENAWTVTGNTFLTLSSTGDTGSTTITATAPSYSGVTARTDTLTFTDSVSGDEAALSIKQKKYSSGQPVYLGGNEVNELYLGDHQINEAYLGDVRVYSSGPFMGLKVSPKTISFNSASLSATCKVKSSESWTMVVPAWLTASTLTGDTGETVVTLTATAQTASTSGSIVVTTANYSASASCEYQEFTPVNYIHSQNMGDNRDDYKLPTGIYPTLTTKAELKFQYKGYSTGNWIVGMSLNNDDKDWRFFNYNKPKWCLDISSGRLNPNVGTMTNDRDYDFEFGNFYITNKTDNISVTGATQTGTLSEMAIEISLGIVWINELKLWQGETLVFDGKAAKMGNQYGLFDTVGGNFITSTSFTIVGEE